VWFCDSLFKYVRYVDFGCARYTRYIEVVDGLLILHVTLLRAVCAAMCQFWLPQSRSVPHLGGGETAANVSACIQTSDETNINCDSKRLHGRRILLATDGGVACRQRQGRSRKRRSEH